ncbi:MAG: hypothetical protein RSE41_08850 [Clostridia bacterium]
MIIKVKVGVFCPLSKTNELSKYEAVIGECLTPDFIKKDNKDIENELVV